jgi:XRE family transcriptional regulator, regulator of sulfur utilization
MPSSRTPPRRSLARPSAAAIRLDVVPPRIGAVLHGIRLAQKLSLDKVAATSGVSKSMLSQIERDLTNPTFATLWRLANALGVTIEDLLRGTNRDRGIEVTAAHAVPSLSSADSKCLVRILSPMELTGRYEWYEMRFGPHGELVSDPHEPGTVEHLTVVEGRVGVESAGERQELGRGATAQYRGDQPHAIRNLTARNARVFVVVTFWPRKSLAPA